MGRPTPHGVGGLKSPAGHSCESDYSPTPHGVGGLKWKSGAQAGGGR